MGLSVNASHTHFCAGLRLPVLGGTTCAIRYCRGYSGDDSCVYRTDGNPDFENAEVDHSIGRGPIDRDWRRCDPHEPFVLDWRSHDQPGWSRGTVIRCIHVVDRGCPDQEASATCIETDECRGADVKWRSSVADHCSNLRGVLWLPCGSSFLKSMASAPISDRVWFDYRLHRVHLASFLQIAHAGGYLCICQPCGGGDPWLFCGGGNDRGTYRGGNTSRVSERHNHHDCTQISQRAG